MSAIKIADLRNLEPDATGFVELEHSTLQALLNIAEGAKRELDNERDLYNEIVDGLAHFDFGDPA